MSKINEILTSVILYCIVSYTLNLSCLTTALLFAILGSNINTLLPKNYKHTLLVCLPLLLLLSVYPIPAIAVTTGYVSSILVALMSKDGCKLIYPIRTTAFTGPSNYLENNTRKDYAATTFLITLTVIALMFSFNGMELMETLSYGDNQYVWDMDYKTNSTEYPIHYININPAQCVNKNITTLYAENRTTTLITNYSPS